MLNLDTHVLIFALTGALRKRERELLSENNWSVSAIALSFAAAERVSRARAARSRPSRRRKSTAKARPRAARTLVPRSAVSPAPHEA